MDGDKGPGLMLTLGLCGSWVGGGGAQGGAGSWTGGAGPALRGAGRGRDAAKLAALMSPPLRRFPQNTHRTLVSRFVLFLRREPPARIPCV